MVGNNFIGQVLHVSYFLVLRDVRCGGEGMKRKTTQPKRKPPQIQFVRKGKTGVKRPVAHSGILDQAGDWNLSVDLDRQLTFPVCSIYSEP